MTDTLYRMEKELALKARLLELLTLSAAESAIYRKFVREQTRAAQVASVFMGVAEQVKEWNDGNIERSST